MRTNPVRMGDIPYVPRPVAPDDLDRRLKGAGVADPIQIARP